MPSTLPFSTPRLPKPLSSNYSFVRDEWPEHLLPIRVHSVQGQVENAENILTRDEQAAATLTRQSGTDPEPCIILDYGFAVAGIPFIKIQGIESSTTGPLNSKAALDFTVSEGYPGILRPDGDGPYPFSAGADTRRRVRFRLKGQGLYESKYVQGSQRWLKLTLVSPAPFSVRIALAGFIPTTSNLPLNRLPGAFQCSDNFMNQLWEYGARTLQLNCIPPRTVPPPWQVSEDMGVLIDSQRCNAYGWGANWTDYEVKFTSMILDGGLAWTVRAKAGPPSVIFIINIGVHKTTLEQWFGYYNQPQITLEPRLISTVDITHIGLELGNWFAVKTICVGTADFKIIIEDCEAAVFKQGTLKAEGFGAFSSCPPDEFPQQLKGSVGIGAGNDQLCRFKDMSVTSVPDGETLYESGLNNPAVLADFGIGWNQFAWISDGAKRDRYPWTADIIIGGRSLYYSTAGVEYVRGNIVTSMLRTGTSLLSGGGPPGRDLTRTAKDEMFNVLTVNYSLYLLLVIYDFWMHTGDDSLLEICWERIKGCLAYTEDRINERGLLEVYNMDAGDYDYYNGLQEGVSTKRNALYVTALRACAAIAKSSAIFDQELSLRYESYANRTFSSIQEHCFDKESRQFIITESRKEGFQQEAHAWLISQGILPPHLLSETFQNFNRLTSTTHNGAPLSFTPDTPSVPRVISPIMSAFQIEAAIHSGRSQDAEDILRKVWAPMADKTSPHFTGTTWEFLKEDGTPFKDDFCSYAQLFSAGPTYLLSRYVLGVESVEAGFKKFIISPRLEIAGLKWAQGRVPTPVGSCIEVRWQMFDGRGWRIECTSPGGLSGRLIVSEYVWSRRSEVLVNGETYKGGEEIDIPVGAFIDVEVIFW
ncbi:alpha-l-rhamnosidase [Penicillium malachiteum]|uniref:alpha-l-rhamnosidase n=1 Tax=Penicillium malachiteum TaxID=1324776 RepID=UPI0025497B5F|nr:alpha-l-rhamnosidase [Penicillium malachiteum]KAJ5720714.1 alpha-l-rhamnosidase [Penicillium malachiteum]